MRSRFLGILLKLQALWGAAEGGQVGPTEPPTGLANLTLMNNHGIYTVWVAVGTPPQLQECVVDMTSSDSYFISNKLQDCSRTPKTCTFVFEENMSSTLYYYPSTFPSFVSTAANFTGSFASDDVLLGIDVLPDGVEWNGGYSLTNTTFGLAQNGTGYGTDTCVVGLGLKNGESCVTTMENGEVSPVYDNLPIAMKNQGFVNRASYSVYLNTWTSKTGFVLFGGIDHAKYHGNLSIVPLVDYAVDASLGTKLVGNPTDFQVVLNGISVSDGNRTIPIASMNFAVSLSLGNTLTTLPASVVKPLAKVLGLSSVNDELQYIFPCDREASIVFDLSGVEIAVPLSEYAYSLDANMTDGSPACAMLMTVQDDPLWCLGDPFVRATYIYVDLELFLAAIAPVKYTIESDVEMAAANGSISGAHPAPHYNASKLTSAINVTAGNTTFFPIVEISAAPKLRITFWAIFSSILFLTL